MKKIRCALIGSGNIGTDLIYKIQRSPVLEPVWMVGIDATSEGLARAREALDEPEGALAAIAALLRQPVPPAVQLEAATLAGRIALESAPADAARGRDLIDRTSALDAPTAMRHEAEVVAAAHLLGSGETAEGLLVVADHVAGGSPEAVLLAAEAHAARGAPVAARALLEEVVPGSGAPAALRVLELVGDVTALARLGDELRGRAVATPGDDELRLQADLASGLAALGAGMARQAVTLLRPCATSPGCGRAGLVLAGPRLVEALAIARERDAAARVLSRLAAADRSAVEQIDLDPLSDSGRVNVQACSARAAGLVMVSPLGVAASL